MNSRTPAPPTLRRRGPAFADLALAGAILLVLALSWHGIAPPERDAVASSTPVPPERTAAR